MAPPIRRKRTAEADSNVHVIASTPSKVRKQNDSEDDGGMETPQARTRPGASTPASSVIGRSTSSASPAASSNSNNHLVTPATADHQLLAGSNTKTTTRSLKHPHAKRTLVLTKNDEQAERAPVTPSPETTPSKGEEDNNTGKPQPKRRLIFGRLVTEIVSQPNTKRVYQIVKKLTGSIGGNGSSGPIYGELTMGSMQKMINLMKECTGLSSESKFLDVGSGIGKPNLHVMQDPGVAFSCGIEMELDRWRLGLKCLQAVLNAAADENGLGMDDTTECIQHKGMLIHGNIMEAQTLDPFTHVYMFSIGFPPPLWIYLSECWNRSTAPYMICYHAPRNIIEKYGFDVELVAQTQTSMHGSKEGHMGYIYRRTAASTAKNSRSSRRSCDPVFQSAYENVQGGLQRLRQVVDETVQESFGSEHSRTTRSKARQQGLVLSRY